MWIVNRDGQREFSGGKDDWDGAARVAQGCADFREDVEEELVVDGQVSCYNCRYRRWTAESFACLKRAG